MESSTISSNPTTPPTINGHLLLRTLILAYGGVALLQWVHTALLGGAEGVETSGYDRWLRDGTLALPFVALAVTLGSRRNGILDFGFWILDFRLSPNPKSKIQNPKSDGLAVASLFAVVMGAGALLRQLFPDSPHGAHEEGALSTTGVLQHTLIIMLVAAVYSLVVEVVSGQWSVVRLPSVAWIRDRGYPRSLIPGYGHWPLLALAALLVLAPAFVFTGGGRAVAQTSFPDQVIHPRGSLTLFARKLSDGTMAYVAPDFGAAGVRPTIEMAEGETLNIILKNELGSDASLHVHGVHYKVESDGTRHSNSFVRPGQQRSYQWVAAPGTAGYWHYHDHVLGDDEGTGGILGGLYGALIVRKPGDPRPAKTFVIVGHDKTLNGRIYPDTPTYAARQGQLVEWVIVSHGNRVHTFHLHGHRWLNPYRQTDPSPGAAANVGSGWEDNHILAPGQSFGFLTIAGEGVGPGMWMYHCHFQDHSSAMKGFFNVLPASGPQAQVETSHFFPETGKTVSGRFLEYWKQNGGLAQQGYPLSEPFQEKSDLDGKTYTVQYFERAVFESHPENPKPYDVLLSQLGTFRYKQKYPNGK